MRGKLILIDGLPGSGKSTGAEDLSGMLIAEGWPVRLWMETDPLNPLHVFKLDPMGAATAAIPAWLAPDEFAQASLDRWQTLLDEMEHGVVTIAESYPFQSSVRVLLQHGVAEPEVRAYWQDCVELLGQTDSALIYFLEEDPRASILRTCRTRGPEWTDYVLNAVKDSPMFKRHQLPPIEAVAAGIAEYSRLTDDLAESWPYARLVLPASPEDYGRRAEVMTQFVMRFVSGSSQA